MYSENFKSELVFTLQFFFQIGLYESGSDYHYLPSKCLSTCCAFESESRSVVSNSVRPHGLYSPWNSLGQNTGVGNLSLLQKYSQPRDQIQVSHIAGRFFTN